MMNQESKRSVTVEDLLRVKRAERPAPEFWAEFDRELRAKQLAALVEKRPWWRSLPRSLGALARYHLPLGATAVLAVTLLSIRDYQPVLPNPSARVADIDVAKAPVAIASSEETVATPGPAEGIETAAPATVVGSSAAAPVASLSASPNSGGELARLVPTISSESGASAAREIRPSARSIAQNRAAAEALLGTAATGFETRALPAVRSTPQEPLAQMSNPAETRRNRFAVAFASAAVGTSPAPTTRVARRLSDEQLYDSIHRFGASGNSVSFKF